MAFRQRRSGITLARRQAIGDRKAYNLAANSETWSTVVFAKDNAAPMQVLGTSPSKAQDHQSSTTTEAGLLSAHSLVSGESLNKKLAIAISVPICFFVLLAVAAVAIYCSRLHRPHRKDASQRGAEHPREDAPQNTAEAQDQQRPAALEENETQPDIKAILEALKSTKTRSESDPTAVAQTQYLSQDEQFPRPSADLSTRRDSDSDDEGTHFSDLEDPFIDRPADTPGRISPLREREAADSEDQSLHEDASHPPGPPPPLEELEDPFVDAGDASTASPSQGAAHLDHQARNRGELADDPGLWLKPARKTDSAHAESRQEVLDKDVQDNRFVHHEQTALGSDERQASREVPVRQQDKSSEAWRSERLEDPPHDREASSHSQTGSQSTVVDDAYTTLRSGEAEAAREAEDLHEQSEVELCEQNSVDQVSDDLVSHIEAVETAKRDGNSGHGYDQSDRPAVQDLAAAPHHHQDDGEQRDTLLGKDLARTARSRSFAGREDDSEDNLLRRTTSR